MESGTRIRILREGLSIKPTEIERITRTIADQKGNSDFYVSHSTLADIEAGSIPSIHKLFSVALCLRVPLTELLLLFGVDSEAVIVCDAKPMRDVPALQVAGREPAFRFQLNFDSNFSTHETTLLRLHPQELETSSPFFRSRLHPGRYRYAIIGAQDDVMCNVLPPRSLVEIDTSQKTVEVFAWRTMRHRPIYLVWHSEGHTCCWCQLDGRELTLVPHPLSRQPARRFRTPAQATVVGRVTNAWLPFE